MFGNKKRQMIAEALIGNLQKENEILNDKIKQRNKLIENQQEEIERLKNELADRKSH